VRLITFNNIDITGLEQFHKKICLQQNPMSSVFLNGQASRPYNKTGKHFAVYRCWKVNCGPSSK